MTALFRLVSVSLLFTLLTSTSTSTSMAENSCARLDNDPGYIRQLKKSAAEKNQIAMLALADHYSKGQCVQRNQANAIKLYKELAGMDNPEAEFRLGLIYLNGFGTEKNFIIANEMFQRAIAHGHPLAEEFLEFLKEEGFDDC